MILKQLTTQQIPILLALSGSPVSGTLFGDVSAELLRPGVSTWDSLTIITDDWIPVGSGYYSLNLDGAAISSLGPNLLRLSSLTSAFDSQVIEIDVVARTPAEIQPIKQCLLFGTLLSANGQPSGNQEVIVRVIDFPFSASSSLATSQPAVTRTNSNGYFEMNLMRLSTVMVEITVSGIRHQFVVPDQSTIALVDALNI